MAYCRNCGKELSDIDKHCPSCGKPQSSIYSSSSINTKKYNLDKKIILISSIIIIIIAASLFLMMNFTNSNSKSVYSPGNVLNGGDYAFNNNQIYFTGINGLSKMNTDGSSIKAICTDNAGSINVLGGWIYYLNYSDRVSYTGDSDVETDGPTIYKIKTDGSQRTKLNNTPSADVSVINGYIYFSDLANKHSFYKMKTDGTELTGLIYSTSYYENIVGEWIYFYTHNKIGKVKTDGTSNIIITDANSIAMVVDDGWIYYLDADDSDGNAQQMNGKIYKMKTDGTEKTKICDDGAYAMNISKGWIYYSNISDPFTEKPIYGTLYKVKTDGTNRAKISSNPAGEIVVINDSLYCFGGSFGNYKIKTDGTGEQALDN